MKRTTIYNYLGSLSYLISISASPWISQSLLINLMASKGVHWESQHSNSLRYYNKYIIYRSQTISSEYLICSCGRRCKLWASSRRYSRYSSTSPTPTSSTPSQRSWWGTYSIELWVIFIHFGRIICSSKWTSLSLLLTTSVFIKYYLKSIDKHRPDGHIIQMINLFNWFYREVKNQGNYPSQILDIQNAFNSRAWNNCW